MIRAGRPYVPKICPSQHSEEIDIATAVLHCFTEYIDSARKLDVMVYFEGPNSRSHGGKGILVNTVDASTDFPTSSPLAAFSLQLESSPELCQQLHQILLERIKRCHCTVRGDCWALGNDAGLREAITTLYHNLQAQA